jgi:sulfite exporter TauE/SafE
MAGHLEVAVSEAPDPDNTYDVLQGVLVGALAGGIPAMMLIAFTAQLIPARFLVAAALAFTALSVSTIQVFRRIGRATSRFWPYIQVGIASAAVVCLTP